VDSCKVEINAFYQTPYHDWQDVSLFDRENMMDPRPWIIYELERYEPNDRIDC
jgi:hypothetical protein